MPQDTSPALLGGLSAAQFLRRHWQRRPLLVRQALPGVVPPLTRAALFALAGVDDVESRLIVRRGDDWALRRGPLPRRGLPPLKQPGWTLLVQGLDLHVQAAHELLRRFDFLPQARVDDLMLSFATEGGGVGPHWDAYDVFLLQVQGRRRWKVGPLQDRRLVEGQPLRLLRSMSATQEWVLDPGDMLYLPPLWAHDGIAEGGECMTASIGLRAPHRDELARALLARLADDDGNAGPIYRDSTTARAGMGARIPAELQSFARAAVLKIVADAGSLNRALGEWLSEPKPQVWFERPGAVPAEPGRSGVRLDRRSRMFYDDRYVYLNGEALTPHARDAPLLRRLADTRRLPASACSRMSRAGRARLAQWVEDGWLHDDE